MKITIYILLLSLVVSLGSINETTAQDGTVVSPYDYCQDGNPIGGGSGYSNTLTSANADIHISTTLTWASLKSTIEGASNGDVIFIDGDLTFNLNSSAGTNIIGIPQGVTIASDRGINGSSGALFKHNVVAPTSYRGLFTTNGTDVRITGIRLQGDRTSHYSTYTGSLGIVNRGFENFEVDNCEFWNFGYSAICLNYITGDNTNYPILGATYNNLIHHNYFHDHFGRLSFGVQVVSGKAVISANVFKDGVQDIVGGAGSAQGYPSYDATCNTFSGANSSWRVDCHGDNEAYSCSTGDRYTQGTGSSECWGEAGTTINIRYNDFQDDFSNRDFTGGNAGYLNAYGVFRGVPKDKLTVEYNRFYEPYHSNNIMQQFWDSSEETNVNKFVWDGGSVGEPADTNTYNNATPSGQTGTIPDITGLKFVNSVDNVIYVDESAVASKLKMEITGSDTGTLTYSKSGDGADQALYSVSNDTLIGPAYDYEIPTDSNTNNIYTVYVTVTSSSGATFTENMVTFVNDVAEGGEVYVTGIAFDNDTQTILVGETVDKSHTFTPTSPDNTGVTYYGGDPTPVYIEHDGTGIYKGTTSYFIRADDMENGLIEDVMTVTINPDAWKQSRVSLGAIKTSGSSGRIYIGK